MITCLVIKVQKDVYTTMPMVPDITLRSITVDSEQVVLILEGEHPPGIPMNKEDMDPA